MRNRDFAPDTHTRDLANRQVLVESALQVVLCSVITLGASAIISATVESTRIVTISSAALLVVLAAVVAASITRYYRHKATR